MIIARFNCPACETPIEAPADAVARGVRCPSCDTGFVPGKVETSDEAVDPSFHTGRDLKPPPPKNRVELLKQAKADREKQEAAAQNAKWAEYHQLKQLADNCIGIIFAVMLLAALCGFLAAVSEDAAVKTICLLLCGAAFSLSMVLFLVGQIFHVRAALEKLSIKD